MRICCYTCITGNYDKLLEPIEITPGVDYICFTDQNFSSNTWKIRPIPAELNYLSNVKKQRIVKICPHRFLSEYDVSIWIDGNIIVKGSLIEFMKQYDLSKSPIYTRIHPKRRCIYDEAIACINLKKDTKEKIMHQINRYKNENYPKNIGMAETNILLRKHTDNKCKLLCNLWASELLLESHRDQLSFNYACWKMHIIPGYMLYNQNLKDGYDKFFIWKVKHG